MKVPVVLSTVDIHVDGSGRITVVVDDQPYAEDRDLRRENVRSVVDEITTNLRTAVRIKLHEADGATYDDYATPPELPASVTEERRPPAPAPALAGAGFQPGEEVALAYVVARQSADEDGKAAINLPPALVNAAQGRLVLLGLSSLTVAPIENPA